MKCPICKKLFVNKTDKNYKNIKHYKCEKDKIDLRIMKKETR